jgi:chloramphenicol O-acetyltransferase
VVTCNQATSDVTKINQLVYMCNQSDIYMTRINHLFNTCTNVSKASHFDYTCTINMVDLTQKKRKAYRPLHFQISYLFHYLSILNDLKSFRCIILSFTNFL